MDRPSAPASSPLISVSPPAQFVRRLKSIPAHELPLESPDRQWLIEDLWAESGVGIIGGEPKACKTYLALDMAVAVASGRSCLHHYPVPHPGPVLVVVAEGTLARLRKRLLAISDAAGLKLEQLPIKVIPEPRVLLDTDADRLDLELEVMEVKPRLLVLDPFVRLHGHVDENSSGAVAPVLGYLRQLQRRYDMAIVVVHHAGKRKGGRRAGQALRGSSDFHAWGDSNLYLRRDSDVGPVWLSTEHRDAPSVSNTELRFHPVGEKGDVGWLSWVAPKDRQAGPASTLRRAAKETPKEEVLRVLKTARSMTLTELRERCHLRFASVPMVLEELERSGEVVRKGERWARISPRRARARSRAT